MISSTLGTLHGVCSQPVCFYFNLFCWMKLVLLDTRHLHGYSIAFPHDPSKHFVFSSAMRLSSFHRPAGCSAVDANNDLSHSCVYACMAWQAVDSEGRTPLDLATDPAIRRILRTEQMVRFSGENFDLLGAVEVNDTMVSETQVYHRRACMFHVV